jgi:hypothetical protein
MDEARRLHREMPLMWLWRVIGRLSTAKRREELRRMSSFVLLERSASYSYARSPAKRMPSMS